MSMTPDLSDAMVELTGPLGQVYRFRYGGVVPYAGTDYVVLLEMECDENGEEQILITRLEDTPEGLSFVVAEEEDVIEQVYSKYCAMAIQAQIEDLTDCDCGDDCCCGHDHHHHEHDCSCGCEYDHHDHGCDCGHCH